MKTLVIATLLLFSVVVSASAGVIYSTKIANGDYCVAHSTASPGEYVWFLGDLKVKVEVRGDHLALDFPDTSMDVTVSGDAATGKDLFSGEVKTYRASSVMFQMAKATFANFRGL